MERAWSIRRSIRGTFDNPPTLSQSIRVGGVTIGAVCKRRGRLEAFGTLDNMNLSEVKGLRMIFA